MGEQFRLYPNVVYYTTGNLYAILQITSTVNQTPGFSSMVPINENRSMVTLKIMLVFSSNKIQLQVVDSLAELPSSLVILLLVLTWSII